MMPMENDEFKIPEKYRNMSVAQLEREEKKLLEQIKSTPRDIQHKKKVTEGRREVTFFI